MSTTENSIPPVQKYDSEDLKKEISGLYRSLGLNDNFEQKYQPQSEDKFSYSYYWFQ